MTLEQAKELHPKFYSHPELWVKAGLLLERENGIVTEILTLEFLAETIKNDDLWKYIPKFKPQEGEAFIKDLEEAVLVGVEYLRLELPLRHRYSDASNFHEFHSKDKMCAFIHKDLGRVVVCDSELIGVTFDTSAYVDKMRELGYHL